MSGRRKPAVMLALLFLALALTGCQPAPAAPAKDAQTLVAATVRDAELPDMLAMPADELTDYAGIEPTLYTSAEALMAGDALLADAVMVFAAVDADSAKAIEALLSDYLSYRKAEMRDYLPEQFAVLERAVLRRDGLYVSLFVSPEAEKLSRAYQAALSAR